MALCVSFSSLCPWRVLFSLCSLFCVLHVTGGLVALGFLDVLGVIGVLSFLGVLGFLCVPWCSSCFRVIGVLGFS